MTKSSTESSYWQFDCEWRKNCGVVMLAGVDEVGRGPLAGPVCAAAVILPPNFNNNQIKDSKKLSLKKRLELNEIIRNEALCYQISTIDEATIDKVNILQATKNAMYQAIVALNVRPEVILIDGMKGDFIPNYNTYKVIGGDSLSLTIAAASIIAKVHRDKIMQELDNIYPEYGFAKNKGYGTAEHLAAIKRYGVTKVHRKTFRIKSLAAC